MVVTLLLEYLLLQETLRKVKWKKSTKTSHVKETDTWQRTGQLFTKNAGGYFYLGWREHHLYHKH